MLYFEDLEVGHTRALGGFELLEPDVVSFARQWDPQPWHIDAAAAARTPMKGLTASSCHSFAIASLLLSRMEPSAVIASLEHRMEMPNPARPGDMLALTVTCTERRESASKPDRGVVTFESVLANQSEVAVLRLRSVLLVLRRPA